MGSLQASLGMRGYGLRTPFNFCGQKILEIYAQKCQCNLTRARDATAVSEEMFVYSRRGQNGIWHLQKYSIGIARHFNVYYESII